MSAPELPEHLTPAEAAPLAGVSTRQLAVLARTGRVESVKTPGGTRRYPSAQFAHVDAYLRGETDGDSGTWAGAAARHRNRAER